MENFIDDNSGGLLSKPKKYLLKLDGFAKKMPTDVTNNLYKKTLEVKQKGFNEKYRTFFGVFLSVLVYAALIAFAYFAYQLIDDIKGDVLDSIDLEDLGLGDLDKELRA